MLQACVKEDPVVIMIMIHDFLLAPGLTGTQAAYTGSTGLGSLDLNALVVMQTACRAVHMYTTGHLKRYFTLLLACPLILRVRGAHAVSHR